MLNARAPITIGNDTHISPGVILTTGGLVKQADADNKRHHYAKNIIIGSGCWIGSGVIILPGVTIGDGTIIGAGAVVTKDIAAHSIAVGVPAKIRDTQLELAKEVTHAT